ncbi:hypothetical protein [Streptomyces sp. NPDC046759]
MGATQELSPGVLDAAITQLLSPGAAFTSQLLSCATLFAPA